MRNFIRKAESSISRFVTKWLGPYKAWLTVLTIIFFILSTAVLVFWVLGLEIVIGRVTYDQEPVFVLTTSVTTVLNLLHRWLLKEAEFSPAVALAEGFVKNYLSRVITLLKEEGEDSPVIYILKPNSLEELKEESAERREANIANTFHRSETKVFVQKRGRKLDLKKIFKSKTKYVYFCTPNTLTALRPFLQFKVDSPSGKTSETEMSELTRVHIDRFFDQVDSALEKEGLLQYVEYCSAEMDFEF